MWYVDDDDDDNDNDDDDDNDDNDDNDGDDDYSCKSIHFYARISGFWMELDLDNTLYMLIMIVMMIMMMIIFIVVIQSIFKLGLPDFAWK